MASANDIKMRILAEDKTAAAFRSAKKNIDATEKAVRTLKAAISIGAATAFVAMTKRMAEAADQTAKFSQRIGINAQAFQELQYAATQSGIKTEQFNMALQRFTRRSAEAAEGTGEAKAALKELGIQLTDSNGKLRPAEDLLGDVAEAFKNIEDPAQRVRLAFKLFDSEGVSMVQMLGEGRDAMAALRIEAQQLGIVMDQDTLKNAEKVSNQFDIMSRVVSTNVMTALVELAPVITSVSKGIAELAKAIKRTIDPWSEFTNASNERKLEKTNQLIDEVRGRIQQLQKAIKGGKRTFSQIFFGTTKEEAEKEIAELQAGLEMLMKTQAALIEAINDPVSIGAQKQQISEMQKYFDELKKGFSDGVTEYANSVESLALETQKATSKMFSRMEDSIVNFAMTGKFAFREFANSVVADIIRIQTRQALAQAIGSSGNIFSAIGNFFGGFFADGGRPPSNKVSVVGEKGPELFVPDSAGTVIPNGGMAMSGGGQPVHVTFNIQSWDSRDTTQAIQQSAPQIVGIIQNAFNKRGRKGPMG